jgi:hypothetical protein
MDQRLALHHKKKRKGIIYFIFICGKRKISSRYGKSVSAYVKHAFNIL